VIGQNVWAWNYTTVLDIIALTAGPDRYAAAEPASDAGGKPVLAVTSP
jgi:hypothetical protein